MEKEPSFADTFVKEVTMNQKLLNRLYKQSFNRDELRFLAESLNFLSSSCGSLHRLMRILLDIEFQKGKKKNDTTTLRGNTLTTKILDHFYNTNGRGYLRVILKTPMAAILSDDKIKNIEIDPEAIYRSMISTRRNKKKKDPDYRDLKPYSRKYIKVQRTLERNTNQLLGAVGIFSARIFSETSIKLFPFDFRLICRYIFDYCQQFELDPLPIVGNLVFLRFINPAIMFPEKLNILSKKQLKKRTRQHRRAFMLISKIIQLLSNNGKSQQEHMNKLFNHEKFGELKESCSKFLREICVEERDIDEKKDEYFKLKSQVFVMNQKEEEEDAFDEVSLLLFNFLLSKDIKLLRFLIGTNEEEEEEKEKDIDSEEEEEDEKEENRIRAPSEMSQEEKENLVRGHRMSILNILNEIDDPNMIGSVDDPFHTPSFVEGDNSSVSSLKADSKKKRSNSFITKEHIKNKTIFNSLTGGKEDEKHKQSIIEDLSKTVYGSIVFFCVGNIVFNSSFEPYEMRDMEKQFFCVAEKKYVKEVEKFLSLFKTLSMKIINKQLKLSKFISKGSLKRLKMCKELGIEFHYFYSSENNSYFFVVTKKPFSVKLTYYFMSEFESKYYDIIHNENDDLVSQKDYLKIVDEMNLLVSEYNAGKSIEGKELIRLFSEVTKKDKEEKMLNNQEKKELGEEIDEKDEDSDEDSSERVLFSEIPSMEELVKEYRSYRNQGNNIKGRLKDIFTSQME